MTLRINLYIYHSIGLLGGASYPVEDGVFVTISTYYNSLRWQSPVNVYLSQYHLRGRANISYCAFHHFWSHYLFWVLAMGSIVLCFGKQEEFQRKRQWNTEGACRNRWKRFDEMEGEEEEQVMQISIPSTSRSRSDDP